MTTATAALIYADYLIHPQLSATTIAEEVGCDPMDVKELVAGRTHPELDREAIHRTIAYVRAALELADRDGEVTPAVMDEEIRESAAKPQHP